MWGNLLFVGSGFGSRFVTIWWTLRNALKSFKACSNGICVGIDPETIQQKWKRAGEFYPRLKEQNISRDTEKGKGNFASGLCKSKKKSLNLFCIASTNSSIFAGNFSFFVVFNRVEWKEKGLRTRKPTPNSWSF